MISYSNVRIYDADGNLKKTITAKSLSKKTWKGFSDNCVTNHLQGTVNQKIKNTDKKSVKKTIKKFPMINCAYKPCNKRIQQMRQKHRFCINPLGARTIPCSIKHKQAISKARTDVINLNRAQGKITSNCKKCKVKFTLIVRGQKYCRNPCTSMAGAPLPIVDIACKMCKKKYKGIVSRYTIYCHNPCTAALLRAHIEHPKVNKKCKLCKKIYEGNTSTRNLYCHNPCNSGLARTAARQKKRSFK